MRQLPPEIQLTRLANAYQLSRAVQVAARLGIGRLVRSGRQSTEQLAAATETQEPVLARLLRFLAELGVVEELEDGGFGPTALSDRLHLVDNIAQGDESWAVWGALPEALRTGSSVFEGVHGAPFYEYAAAHPDQEANWTEWNTYAGGNLSAPIAEALELQGSECVVDVGGGEGGLLTQILERHSGCRGILFDLPGVVSGVRLPPGVQDRCKVLEGDALEQVPRSGDVYVMSRVLMNWDDDAAVRLLERCREAMGAAGVLKVVETLMPPAGDPQRRSLAASDLQLFLVWGGGHRTREQMTALFSRAGLDLGRVSDVEALGWQVLEGRSRRST